MTNAKVSRDGTDSRISRRCSSFGANPRTDSRSAGTSSIGESEEAVMKPSIGRIVHYKNTETEKGFEQGAELAPGIITRVHNDTSGNLSVSRNSGTHYK